MSDYYFVGVFNSESILERPISFPGSTASVLEKMLERSGIDATEDFLFCQTDDAHNPLFYKIDRGGEFAYLIGSEEEKDLWQEGVDLDKIASYPLVFGEIEAGVSLVIDKEKAEAFAPSYTQFRKQAFSLAEAEALMGHNANFAQSALESYESVCKWIAAGQKIFWYKYY